MTAKLSKVDNRDSDAVMFIVLHDLLMWHLSASPLSSVCLNKNILKKWYSYKLRQPQVFGQPVKGVHSKSPLSFINMRSVWDNQKTIPFPNVPLPPATL